MNSLPRVSSRVVRFMLSVLVRVGVDGIGLCLGVESMFDLSERRGRVTLDSSAGGFSSLTSSAWT